MKKLFPLLVVVAMAMFAAAPFMILAAPYESSMGLVSKIFYFHAPLGIAMFVAASVSGIGSAMLLFTKKPQWDCWAVAGAELTSVTGLLVLVTGPLWARRAWGAWWVWDPRITSTLVMWMIFNAYLLLRRFGGPGSERLAAAVALFGMANVPFVYWSVNFWRTMHPKTSVIPTLPVSMGITFWFCLVAILLLTTLLIMLRAELEKRRQELDALYLAAEDLENLETSPGPRGSQ
jgi:heme exporter protein C